MTLIFYFCCFLMLPISLVVTDDGTNNLLDIEPPNFFTYKSPLREPDSLRNQPYFDFLSTLYRHDADKTSLFRPYLRQARSAVTSPTSSAGAGQLQVATPVEQIHSDDSYVAKNRQKRAMIFRPLFVYRQQQIKKQRIYEQHKHRY